MSRRFAWGLLFCSLLGASTAFAQYPARPVRIILPYAAGGGADVLTRLLAQALGDLWKQSVIVDNRPGAGATIGTDVVAKAPADGYTLLMTASTMAVSPTAYPKLPYDVLRDFAPITLVAQSPYVLAVNPSVNAQTFADFLALARSSPGKLNFGSPGNGTLSHLALELLRSRSGIQVTVVPYKGSNPAVLGVLSGQVDFTLDTPPGLMEQVRAQKLRALAVTSARRAPSIPEVPTFIEGGVRDFDVSVWFGLLAPAGTPPDIIGKIHADTVKALATPALVERFKAESLEIVTMQPDEFGAYLRSEIAKWREVIRQANIKFD